MIKVTVWHLGHLWMPLQERRKAAELAAQNQLLQQHLQETTSSFREALQLVESLMGSECQPGPLRCMPGGFNVFGWQNAPSCAPLLLTTCKWIVVSRLAAAGKWIGLSTHKGRTLGLMVGAVLCS